MKKSLIITASLIAFCAFAKAQSLNDYKLAPLDTSSALPGLLQPLKIDTSLSYKLPKVVPYTQFMPVQPLQKNYAEFLTDDNSRNNMPVAKLQSADRMPVLKLGDTENMHYTMLIKGTGNKATNEKPTP